jgi:hypothetical protein
MKAGPTFKRGLGGDVEGCVLPGNGILGVAAPGGPHLVERGHAVTRFEFKDVGADLLDDAGNVIALVDDIGGI